jgi:hypothetical protein
MSLMILSVACHFGPAQGDVAVKYKVVVEHLLAMDLHLLVSPDMVLHLDMMTL